MNKKDTGYAWLIVLQGFIGSSLSDGGIFSFGIFLPLYVQSLNASTSAVSFIGGVAVFASLGFSPWLGSLTDQYGPRIVLFAGAILSAAGYYSASLSTTVWQLLLSQGVLVGMGASCGYVASQAAIGGWFDRRKGLAMGLSGSGTGFGSVFIVVIVNSFKTNGLSYALKTLALFELLGLLIASSLAAQFIETPQVSSSSQVFDLEKIENGDDSHIGSVDCDPALQSAVNASQLEFVTLPDKAVVASQGGISESNATYNSSSNMDETAVTITRTPQSKPSMQDKKSLSSNKKFVLLLIAFGLVGFGDTVPLTYLPLYAQTQGVSVAQSNHLVALLGTGSGIGRIVAGFIADKASKLMLLILSIVICSVLTLGWTGYNSFSSLAGYAFFYGFFDGALNVLVGPLSMELFGHEALGKAMGMLLAVQAFGCLFAGPIAGALYDSSGQFLPIALFSSLTMLVGVIFVVLASSSESTMQVSRPHDFDHRQLSFHALTSASKIDLRKCVDEGSINPEPIDHLWSSGISLCHGTRYAQPVPITTGNP